MSQKLPVFSFKCVEDSFNFIKDFIENYNEEINIGYFKYPKEFINFITIYHFTSKNDN